jgi:GAF domain-containing protein
MDAGTPATAELRRALDALGALADLESIVAVAAERGRDLVGARALVVELEIGAELVVVAVAGEAPSGLIGERLDREHSVAGYALRTHRTQRLDSAVNRARYDDHGLGRRGLEAAAAVVVPLVLGDASHGALVAIDRVENGPAFGNGDEALLEEFAVAVAVAVATAKT